MEFYNERGVIATSYDELQSLHVIRAARAAHPLPKASQGSFLQTIFQAAEITLFNLSDLFRRAALDVADRQFGLAMGKLLWARGFHRVLVRISMICQQTSFAPESSDTDGRVSIRESPAFSEYMDALKQFDTDILRTIEQGDLRAAALLADQSLDNAAVSLLHLARICNHESLIWERNLVGVALPGYVGDYDRLVASQKLREAVYGLALAGETYFTQFRGLHQIPEILCLELNDRLEEAARAILADQLPRAVEYLHDIDLLLEGILAALPPIVDSLTTADYHQIRENLGLTSGSHSVSLHYHLFRDLYEQFAHALLGYLNGKSWGVAPAPTLEGVLHTISRIRFDTMEAWMIHLLSMQALKLRAGIDQWREVHQHLPRNNLGGQSTRSLTGSPDAIRAVRQIYQTAHTNDLLQPVADARQLAKAYVADQRTPLALYVNDRSSLDSYLLRITGEITQRRFQHVQERTGIFGSRCPFVAPPRRKI